MPESSTSFFQDLLPFLFTLAVSAAILFFTSRWLNRGGQRHAGEGHLVHHVTLIVLTAIGLIALTLTLPVGETVRGQLIGLLGLVFSAVIALASTTFVANAMAGLMLRAVRNFKPGDFVRAGDAFGRVTERGLFHTEIQTEDRDLMTVPNLYLVTHPVSVVRASGTIVSARLSLGYDVGRRRAEELLITAAEAAELSDPFVHVVELGDHAVSYRVAGFLSEVKHLLSVRSRLRKRVLDALHGAGVEIASPVLMNQRPMEPGAPILPTATGLPGPDEAEPVAEPLVFDKADRAAHLETMRAQLADLDATIEELKASRSALDGDARAGVDAQLATHRQRREILARALEHAQDTIPDE